MQKYMCQRYLLVLWTYDAGKAITNISKYHWQYTVRENITKVFISTSAHQITKPTEIDPFRLWFDSVGDKASRALYGLTTRAKRADVYFLNNYSFRI